MTSSMISFVYSPSVLNYDDDSSRIYDVQLELVLLSEGEAMVE